VQPKKILITGASGFVGGRLLKSLTLSHPDAIVLGTGRRNERQAEFAALGCQFETGDLVKFADCERLAAGADVIIHCAGLSSPWGTYPEFYDANVLSTLNLLQTAQEQGARRFILISTPSVYFNFRDRYNIKESDPLPNPMVNNYAVTKYEAEQATLQLNRPDFETIALRPRAIIGAEDAVIFPRVLRAYHEGKLKIVGNGKNVVDLTCVANLIHAVEKCLQAEHAAFGEVYNISNGEPAPLWDSVGYLLKALNLPPVTQKVPAKVALGAAALTEFIHRYFLNGREPALTRYSIGILSNSMTMDISKARTKLGYTPIQSTLEGINEFVAWYQTQNKSH